jgi:hypothetical protein
MPALSAGSISHPARTSIIEIEVNRFILIKAVVLSDDVSSETGTGSQRKSL